MNKTGEETYDELRNGIIKPFIFYIPYNALPVEAKKIINETPVLKVLFDVIVSIDKNLHTTTGEGIYQNNLEHINKSIQLETQIIKLIEFKDNSSPTLFKFIFDKYYTLVSTFDFVSNWMNENFIKYFNPFELKTEKTLFQFQAEAFKSHLNYLNENFKTITPKPKPQKEITQFLQNEYSSLNIIPSSQPTAAAIKAPATSTPTPAKKNNKKQPITAEEARNYLLETVFNVNFEQ